MEIRNRFINRSSDAWETRSDHENVNDVSVNDRFTSVDRSFVSVDDANTSVSDYRRKGFAGSEKSLIDVGKHWYKDFEPPDAWDGPHVQNRLIHAYKTLAFTPMPKNSRPASYGSAWPQYSYKFDDLVAQADAEDEQLKAEANRRNFVRPRPTREQLTQMDTLFNTVYEFRNSDPTGCAILLSWAHARYRNINLSVIAGRFSVSTKTIHRESQRIASLCSISLNRRTIRPW